MVLWEAWFEKVEAAEALDSARRRELLARGSDLFFRYADLLSDYVAQAHQREAVERSGNGEQRRFRAVKEFLGGEQLAVAWLDFELERHHLGLIAWGEDPAGAAGRLAAELGRPLLAVSPQPAGATCWVWISGARPLDPTQQRALRRFAPQRAQIALGLEAFGEAGFRASHRQALRARRFAPEHGSPLTHYADVALEALAFESEEDARAFVAHELRGIEDDSSRSRDIRETLAAYFAAEYNAACAGATLGVHQQTVANRLRAAEERLGCASIHDRRIELELALRLRASFSPQHA
jgi:DNA-binding PucR family transcriptional regulator